MFKQASCYFRSGSDWEADPVTFRPNVDRESQTARFVSVPLGDRTASVIKCRFHFGDLWMLFSEVAFQSGRDGIKADGGFYWRSTIKSSPFPQAQQSITHLSALTCKEPPETCPQVSRILYDFMKTHAQHE